MNADANNSHSIWLISCVDNLLLGYLSNAYCPRSMAIEGRSEMKLSLGECGMEGKKGKVELSTFVGTPWQKIIIYFR